jgi:DNA-binding transcriptional regulator YdaS (Cro superfamily)
MTLADYLHKKRMTHTDFAAIIGVSISMVTRYVSEQRVPVAGYIEAIERATNGEVTLADWARIDRAHRAQRKITRDRG